MEVSRRKWSNVVSQYSVERFNEACEQVRIGRVNSGGIGTLGEKTLHATLKQYFEPDGENHEAKIGRYFVDIITDDGIVEIQTQGLDKLRTKLGVLLDVATVTVVYPIAHNKWLQWINPDTGELSNRRKSPKRGSFYTAFYELYKLKMLLNRSELRVHLMLIDMEEYRNLNGWSGDKKRGSTRHERIPLTLVDECKIHHPADWQQLVPESLPAQFTSRDFAKAAKLQLRYAQTGLNVLHHVGAVKRCGKQGQLYLYERVTD